MGVKISHNRRQRLMEGRRIRDTVKRRSQETQSRDSRRRQREPMAQRNKRHGDASEEKKLRPAATMISELGQR